jgi:hypothetical protein
MALSLHTKLTHYTSTCAVLGSSCLVGNHTIVSLCRGRGSDLEVRRTSPLDIRPALALILSSSTCMQPKSNDTSSLDYEIAHVDFLIRPLVFHPPCMKPSTRLTCTNNTFWSTPMRQQFYVFPESSYNRYRGHSYARTMYIPSLSRCHNNPKNDRRIRSKACS